MTNTSIFDAFGRMWLHTVNELGSGGSSNILNADGIIKQEHLPEGYPYKKVEEYCALPETTLTEANYNADFGGFLIMQYIPLTEGVEYTVNWKGVEYKSNAVADNFNGMPIIALGNFGAMNGGENTGEPFIFAAFTEEGYAMAGFGGGAIPLDGSTEFTISISGAITTVTKIAEEFVPGNKVLIVNGQAESYDADVDLSMSYADMRKAIIAGYYIVACVEIYGTFHNMPIMQYGSDSIDFKSIDISFGSESATIIEMNLTVIEGSAATISRTVRGLAYPIY